LGRPGRAIAVLAITALVGIVVWTFIEPPPQQVIRFSDGSQFTLVGVTYGKEHFPPGNLQQRLFQYVPDSLAKQFKLKKQPRYTNAEPRLIFWGKPDRDYSDFYSGWPRMDYVLVDERGVEVPVGTKSLIFPRKTTGEPLMPQGWGLTFFNRRAETIRLRIYGTVGGTRVRAGELILPNPVHEKFPVWQPERLPIIRTNGDLTITLTRLIVDAPSKQNTNPTSARAFIEITRRGERISNWSVAGLELSDVTGNRLQVGQFPGRLRGDNGVWEFSPTLWPNEPAWKLRVEFAPKEMTPFTSRTFRALVANPNRQPGLDTTGYSDDEIWIVKGIPIPATNSTTKLNLQTNFQGCTVSLLALGESLQRMPVFPTNIPNLKSLSESPYPMLSMKLTGNVSGTRLALASVIDDQGRPVPMVGNRQTGPTRNSLELGCRLQIKTDAKTLDVAVAVVKSRFVEFIVKPEIAPTNITLNIQTSAGQPVLRTPSTNPPVPHRFTY
jgi:hypothetical protein